MKPFLFGVAASVLLVPAAQAKDTKFHGCVQYVPTMCKGIRSGDSVYLINTANPPIPLNTGAVVTGAVTEKWSPCPGKWVEVKSWKADPKACK